VAAKVATLFLARVASEARGRTACSVVCQPAVDAIAAALGFNL
jgi:hypothetical protein